MFCRSIAYIREKAMAPHSSTVAQKIPQMEEPGRLQSMGSLRVRHNWETSLSLSTFMHWRRKWRPTPVFLPGESHGRISLVGCSPWGRTELDTTEATWQQANTFTSPESWKLWSPTQVRYCFCRWPALTTNTLTVCLLILHVPRDVSLVGDPS